jgi:hypothetical protein
MAFMWVTASIFNLQCLEERAQKLALTTPRTQLMRRFKWWLQACNLLLPVCREESSAQGQVMFFANEAARETAGIPNR